MPDRPPNFLIITDDQHHAGCLSCDDRPQVRTPNLDALAADGVMFRRSYVPAICCVPSRISFLTGMYPHSHGVYNDGSVAIPPHYTSLPHQLREQLNYRTAIVGKKHYARWPDEPFEFNSGEDCEGYRDYLASQGLLETWRRESNATVRDFLAYESDIPTEHSEPVWCANTTMDWIDKNGDEPFFMWCNFDRPHPPITVPKDFTGKYDPDEIDLSQVRRATAEHRRRYLLSPGSRRYGVENAWSSETLDEARYRKALALYYGMVSLVDDNVGRMVRRLDERGLLDNTIIAFTSDHGDFAGEFGQLGKNTHGIYEAIHRVPLIWYWRGHFGTERVHSFVENIDIFPTVCDLVGIDTPAQVQGESFADTLLFSAVGPGPGPETKEVIYHDTPFVKAVRTRRWWLTYNFDGERWGELYDLQDDPDQMNNLWHDARYAEVREEMERKLLDWWIRTDQPIGFSPTDKPNPPSRWHRDVVRRKGLPRNTGRIPPSN